MMPTKLKQLRAKTLLMNELHLLEEEAEEILSQLSNDQRVQVLFSLKAQKELFIEVIYRLMTNTNRSYSQAVQKLIQLLDKNPDTYELKKWQVELLFAPSKPIEKEIEELMAQEAYVQADRAGVRQAYVRERLNALHIMPALTKTLKFSKEEAKKIFYELAKYSERIHQFPGLVKNQLRDFFSVLSELRKRGISPEEAQADILNIIDNKPSQFSHFPGYLEKVQNLGFRKWYIETLVSEAMKAEIMKNELFAFPENENSKAKIKETSIALRQCINEQKLKLHEETLLEMFLDKKAQESPEITKFKEELETSIVEDFIKYELGGSTGVELFEYSQSAASQNPGEQQESTLFRIPPPQTHPLAQALEGPIRELYTTFISSIQNCTAAFPQELAPTNASTQTQAETVATPLVSTKERNTYSNLIESIMISYNIPPYQEAVKILIKLLQSSHEIYDLKIAQVELLAQEPKLEKEIKASVMEIRARQQDMMGVQQCALRYQFEAEKNKAQFANKELVVESIHALWAPLANNIRAFENERIRIFEELLQKRILAFDTPNYDPKKMDFLETFYRELRKSILIDMLYYQNTAGPNVDFLQGDNTPLHYGYPPQVMPLFFPEELFKDKLAEAGPDLVEIYERFIKQLHDANNKLPKDHPAWKVLEEHIGKYTPLEVPAPTSPGLLLPSSLNLTQAAWNGSLAEVTSQTPFSNLTSASLSPTFLSRLPNEFFSATENGITFPIVASIVLLASLACRLAKPYRHGYNKFFGGPPIPKPDSHENPTPTVKSSRNI